MAENYKHLYEQMKKMVAMYQDEIVPGMREQLENRVEVVRCKDCEKSGVLEHNGKLYCKEPMGCLGCVPTKPDNFCSYGERKTDESSRNPHV